jgi:2-keto-3-deoxy-L-rhamnonate aldolase RhmA
MTTNLQDKLKNGENIYGTCIISTSPLWSKIVSGSGLDFVFLHTEHIPMDRTELTIM